MRQKLSVHGFIGSYVFDGCVMYSKYCLISVLSFLSKPDLSGKTIVRNLEFQKS